MDEGGSDVVRYVSLLRSASQAGDVYADDSILELQNAIAIRAENGGSEAAESVTKLRAAGLWVLD